MNKLTIISLLAIAVAIALGLGAAPGSRDAGPAEAHDIRTLDPTGYQQNKCHEFLPPSHLFSYAAADELVPDGYTVAAIDDPNTPADERVDDPKPGDQRRAEVVIGAYHCESITVAGETIPDAIGAHMVIAIVPYDDFDCSDPAGQCCQKDPCPAEPPPHPSYFMLGMAHDDSSNDPGLGRLENYFVEWVTNKREDARWLRHATGLGDKVKYVPGLEWRYDPQPEHFPGAIDPNFFFRAPAPAPSPFHIEGTFVEPGTEIYDLAENEWADTAVGTVIVFGEHHLGADGRFSVGDGTFTSDDAGSPLGRMLGDAQTRKFTMAEGITAEFKSIQWTKCVRRTADGHTPDECSPDNHADPNMSTPCTAAERRADLEDEQTDVLHLLSHYGPGDGTDLTTLGGDAPDPAADGAADLAALAAGDPESRTAYGLLTHQFVSFGGMGVAIANTGAESGKPGKPGLLFYAPAEGDVKDPYRADFPYRLAGWGYIGTYDHSQHPTFLGPCIERGDWFVHERGVHPADTWGMVPLPPEEEVHGTAPGQDPVLPSECLPPPPTCVYGLPHERFWDIHLWRADDGVATASILNPGEPISGIDPGVGVSPPANWPNTTPEDIPSFYYPPPAPEPTPAPTPAPLLVVGGAAVAASVGSGRVPVLTRRSTPNQTQRN